MTLRHALHDIALFAAIDEAINGAGGEITQDMTAEQYQQWNEDITGKALEFVDKGDDRLDLGNTELQGRDIRLAATALLKLGSDENLSGTEEQAYRRILRMSEQGKVMASAVTMLQEKMDTPVADDARHQAEVPYLQGLAGVMRGMPVILKYYVALMDGTGRGKQDPKNDEK